MEVKELYDLIVTRFSQLPGISEILQEQIVISAVTLSPQEAIGITERKDYPILTGKEVMLEATYRGYKGQAFTEAPASYCGTLQDILQLPFHSDSHARGILIATINAVMASIGLCDRTIHCKNEGPKQCGVAVAQRIAQDYPDKHILLVGYQPSMLQNLADQGTALRVLDLNPENIGRQIGAVTVENGMSAYADALQWADLILCTGSTVCNGSLVQYLHTGKETLFFGTTLAGVAQLLQLNRICYA